MLYRRIQPSASGLSSKQIGFNSDAEAMNTAAARSTDIQAWVSVSLAWGSSRFWVRGLRASYSRSAIRLNPIAAHRAEEKAITTRRTVRVETDSTLDAASTPSSANGSANKVCGSLTKLTYRVNSESPENVWASRGGGPAVSRSGGRRLTASSVGMSLQYCPPLRRSDHPPVLYPASPTSRPLALWWLHPW